MADYTALKGDVIVRSEAINTLRAMLERIGEDYRAAIDRATWEGDDMYRVECDHARKLRSFAYSLLNALQFARHDSGIGAIMYESDRSLLFNGYLLGGMIDHAGDMVRIHT